MVSANIEEWQVFRVFPALGPAEAMKSWLEFEGVPCRVEPRNLQSGIEREYELLVKRTLAHRARWIVAQARPSDAELDFLATGKLPEENN